MVNCQIWQISNLSYGIRERMKGKLKEKIIAHGPKWTKKNRD